MNEIDMKKRVLAISDNACSLEIIPINCQRLFNVFRVTDMTDKVTPLARRGTGAKPPRRGIVSSSHLVSARSVELSELEFGLIVAWNAFSHWAVRCMAAAGCPELTITDVLVLHHICHRARNKKLGDICFVLNVEDTHVVGYSLRKLLAAGLAAGDKVGKEVFYSPTAAGEAAVMRYREVREACLIDNLQADRNADIGETARLLRTMSGLYDQAARAATSL
jgi:predicted MarR family transcription regulator